MSDAELIGARVTIHEPGGSKLVATRAIAANRSYKSGGALEAHFGLGGRGQADVKVWLPGGRTVVFESIDADRILVLDLAKRSVRQ